MEKYTILSTEHSIVQSDMIDVEVGQNGHFVKCFRVSRSLKNAVPGTECVEHHGVGGAPIAYCFGNEMHIVDVPVDMHAARHMIYQFASIRHASLDLYRFYMAMRAAMRWRGVRPSLSGAKNLMTLARLQAKTREK